MSELENHLPLCDPSNTIRFYNVYDANSGYGATLCYRNPEDEYDERLEKYDLMSHLDKLRIKSINDNIIDPHRCCFTCKGLLLKRDKNLPWWADYFHKRCFELFLKNECITSFKIVS